jgi:hypothetical protein
VRAERKWGRLYAESQKAKGAAAGGRRNGLRGAIVRPRSGTPTLAEMGVSKSQAARRQKLAQIRGDTRRPDAVLPGRVEGGKTTCHAKHVRRYPATANA